MLNLDDWLPLSLFDSEGPMLPAPTDLRLGEVTADESFKVTDGVSGISVEEAFCRFTNSFMSYKSYLYSLKETNEESTTHRVLPLLEKLTQLGVLLSPWSFTKTWTVSFW
jgi:hypothetical protein